MLTKYSCKKQNSSHVSLREESIQSVSHFITNNLFISQETETLSPKRGMNIISLNSVQNVPIYRQFLTLKEKTYKNTEQLSIYIRSELNV